MARWERWENCEVARWEVPGFIRGWGGCRDYKNLINSLKAIYYRNYKTLINQNLLKI